MAVLTFAFPLSTEGETLDSLYTIYLNATGHTKTESANSIFAQLRQRELMDTLLHFDRHVKADVVDSYTHYWMAEYYFDQDQFESSMQACERARDMMGSINDDRFKSDVMGLLANANFRIGNYDKSLEALIIAYQIDKRLGDDELISSDLNTFASIYLAVHQPQPGIDYIEQAIAIERKMKRNDRLSIRLGLASELYLTAGQVDKAMEAIREAYEIDLRDGREEKAAIRLSQMSDVYEAMSQFDKAWDAASKALNILEKEKSIYSSAVCCKQLGDLSLKKKDTNAAQTYFKRALELSIQSGSTMVERDAEHGLWQSLRDANPAVAMLHLERYTVLNDSLNKRITTAQIGVMNSTTQFMEQAEIDKRHETRNKILLMAGIVLSVMTLLTVGGLFYAWRRNKRALQLQRQTHDMRSHFIDNISHKLQTPLTVIMDAGAQLQENRKINSEEIHRIGNIIYKHGDSMLVLVNQLLDIEKLRHGTKTEDSSMRADDITMFVRLLTENFSQRAREKQISLEFIPPSTQLNVKFVPEHVRKIIHTLIDNAFKFTPKHGTITVKLEAPDKSHISLQVSDTGNGIPAQELNRVFEPFYQSSFNNHEGFETAVDLALVKQLVDTMDGTITVDSKPGQGTTFTIVFPAMPASSQEANTPDTLRQYAETRIMQKTPSTNKPLVFIVENNDDVAFFIASHLRELYQLRFLSEGQEALRLARDLVPDLVITNMTLPVMDGKELTHKLRNDSALCHIPIIAMTSVDSESERISCLQAGVDAVLVKPFNSNELLLLAQHLIDQRAVLIERFSKLSSDTQAPSMSKEDTDFINRLVDIIHVQMEKGDIDMERTAAAMSVSRKMLRQRVMDITGLTPVTFALQVRLKRARRMLLENEDMPLSLIATKCGFQTPSHFSKSFKQQYGISPLQYRKRRDDIGIFDSGN